MILTEKYWCWPGEISEENCKKILDYFTEKKKNLIKDYGETSITATTHNESKNKEQLLKKKPRQDLTEEEIKSAGEEIENYYIRDTDIVFGDDSFLYDIFTPYLNGANQSANWNFDFDFIESVQYAEYYPGQFYGWHPDSGDIPHMEYERDNPHHWLRNEKGEPLVDEIPTLKEGNVIYKPKAQYTDNKLMVGKIRKLSLSCSLSEPENYEGGGFFFDEGPHQKERFIEIEQLKTKGTVLVFPSFMYHRVEPITKGLRQSIVMWAMGPPYK